MLLALDLWSFYLRRSGWARFISTFLLFYAQIIATEFVLGLFSTLGSYSLGILNFILSIVIIFALIRKASMAIFRRYFGSLRRTVTDTGRLLRRDPLWLTLSLLVVAFIAWIIFLGILFPVVDWDGNTYHLTFVGNMVQNHNFFDVPTSIPWLTGYPKGGEFIQAWSVLISHNDMFTDLTQVPFLILGVYALYEIALRLGINKKPARFAAMLFVFIPIVLNQLKTSYVDVMLCTLFFAGLAMVIRQKFSKLDFLLVGIIFSLLIAVKPTGAFFVLALLPLLFWNLYQNYGKAIRSYIQPLWLMLLPTSFGLYWYIKDWVLYGSPIYPFGFKLAGFTLFPGKTFQEFSTAAIQSTSLPKGCVQRIWFVWTERKDWFGCLYNYDTNYAGLGPIWFIILIPAFIVSIYFAVKKRNALYLVITAIIAALFAIYPTNYYSRYTMFVTAVGILGLSLTLTYIKRSTGNLVKIFAIILAASVIATNFVLCNFPPRAVKAQFKSFLAGNERGPAYANTPGPAFVFLEARIQPGEVVTYDSNPYFIYPLWRPDYLDKVIFVPAQNEANWYKGIGREHVKYAFTMIGSKENKWAKNRLKEIYKDPLYEIFQTH